MSQNQTAAAPTAVSRGFASLPCLRCGEVGSVAIMLHDLTGNESIHCHECENDYGLDEARAAVASWSLLLEWVDSAPAID